MITLHSRFSEIVVIGCGGVFSWAARPLVALLKQSKPQPPLILVDGDTVEKRNLDRQWFAEADIGRNKAEALAASLDYPAQHIPHYYANGAILPVSGQVLFLGCADNHAARRAILNAVDRGEGAAIIAGNEYTESESYWYELSMKDTPADPRVYYPAILTDNSGDPTRPAGCTGPAAEASPQLVLANNSAANALHWLFYHHLVERPAAGEEYPREYMPVKIWNYGPRFITTRLCDLKGAAQEVVA